MGADAVVILTEWNVFRGLDLKRMARDMRQPVLVDFRNLFSISDAKGTGMAYHSIGRASVMAGISPTGEFITQGLDLLLRAEGAKA